MADDVKVWYGQGDAEAKAEAARREAQRAASQEFFLAKKESRKALFVEDVTATTFSFWLHKLRVDGVWPPVSATCTLTMGQCFTCAQTWHDGKKMQKFQRHHIKVVSLVDLTPWSRDGKVSYAVMRVLMMKQKLYERLLGKSTKRKEAGSPEGLKNWVYDISRVPETRADGQDTSWATGNEFEHIAKLEDPFKPIPFIRLRDKDGNDVGPHPGCFTFDNKPISLAPPDYRMLFKPQEAKDLEDLFRNHKVTDGNVFMRGDGGGAGPGPGVSVAPGGAPASPAAQVAGAAAAAASVVKYN